MSTKVAKTMKNPELRSKFSVGQIVNIPTRIAYRHTSKLGVLRRPVLGRVVSMGDRQVDKHYRFAVDIRWVRGVMEVWEEWQMEDIHDAKPDQIQRRAECAYLWDDTEHKGAEVLSAHAGNVAEASPQA